MRADLIWGVPRFELHEKGKRGEEGKGGRDAFTRSKGLPDFRSGVEERGRESIAFEASRGEDLCSAALGMRNDAEMKDSLKGRKSYAVTGS